MLGLHDNACQALETLREWVHNTQSAQPVAVVNTRRHPDSLPWDCSIDAICHDALHQQDDGCNGDAEGGQQSFASDSHQSVQVWRRLLPLLSSARPRSA